MVTNLIYSGNVEPNAGGVARVLMSVVRSASAEPGSARAFDDQPHGVDARREERASRGGPDGVETWAWWHHGDDGDHRVEPEHHHPGPGGTFSCEGPGTARSCSCSWWWSSIARKKSPALTAALREVIEGTTAGDPMSTVKWCRKSTRRVSLGMAPSVIRPLGGS